MLGNCGIDLERLGWNRDSWVKAYVSGSPARVSPFLFSHWPQKQIYLLIFPLLISFLPTRISMSIAFKQLFCPSLYNKDSCSASLAFSSSLIAKYDGGYGEKKQSKNLPHVILPKFSPMSQTQHGCYWWVFGKNRGHGADSPAFSRAPQRLSWKVLSEDSGVQGRGEGGRQLQRRNRNGQVVQEQRQGGIWCSYNKLETFLPFPPLALQSQTSH